MPECAPVSTHPGQEGLREAGSGAKTGLEEPHKQLFPVTCLALDAKRALCSPSLAVVRPYDYLSLAVENLIWRTIGFAGAFVFARHWTLQGDLESLWCARRREVETRAG